jgi:hypothetical protein
MRTAMFLLVIVLLTPNAVRAQDVTIPVNVERLAAKAVETVSVTLDGALLQLAAKFLSSTDREQSAVKSLISNLKGIYVRSFKFAGPGEYSDADVESLRSQLKAPQWSRTASVRSQRHGEDIDVFFKMEQDKIAGLVVIAAQSRELTFVNIAGPIDLDQLAALSGQFGIPKMDLSRPK